MDDSQDNLVYLDNDGRSVHVDEGDAYTLTYGTEVRSLVFQKGFAPTVGVNGIYSEQILAMLIHRYEALDREMPHPANLSTIKCLKEALNYQQSRYSARQQAGTLGTTTP